MCPFVSLLMLPVPVLEFFVLITKFEIPASNQFLCRATECDTPAIHLTYVPNLYEGTEAWAIENKCPGNRQLVFLATWSSCLGFLLH